MENTCAYNLIEAHSQIVYLLDGKLVDLKIFQVVFSLELLRMAQTRCAAVDASNLRFRPTQRMLGRLRCPAAGDEDGLVFPIGLSGPKQMKVCAASLAVLPQASISVEIVDRPRIGVTVVEGLYFLGDTYSRELL